MPLSNKPRRLQVQDGNSSYPMASSTEGFFQESPKIHNQFFDDASLHRAFQLFIPDHLRSRIASDLIEFGDKVLSPQVLRWIADAEKNTPHVKTWNTFGQRKDELVTSEGWRRLQDMGLREGVVALGYDSDFGHHGRLYQFLKIHLWGASSAEVTCPSAMQDGAVALLLRHVQPSSETAESTKMVLKAALSRLVSRDPEVAWTSGQWMTERAGGSDVSNTETRAMFAPDVPSTFPVSASDGSPLGPWQIDGFKWFSSATDANMTVLLAKAGSDNSLSAFFAPTRRLRAIEISSGDEQETEFNGIQIQRLKSKLGTHALPTAELVLQGMRAHLIGQRGQGTKEISSILNITRIHTAIGAIAGWGRGLAISRAFARVRQASGRVIKDIPAHVKGMAQQHVEYRAYTMFTHFVVALLGVSEHGVSSADRHHLVPPVPQARHLLRLLTPVLKALTSLAAIAGLRFCMESLGGVGYLENEDPELNIARLYRDTNVLSIWEGTTDVLAADTVRVLKGKGSADIMTAFQNWVSDSSPPESVLKEVKNIITTVQQRDQQELAYNGRDLMERIAWIAVAVILQKDYRRDDDSVAGEIASRWVAQRDENASKDLNKRYWQERAAWDGRISFDEQGHRLIAETARL